MADGVTMNTGPLRSFAVDLAELEATAKPRLMAVLTMYAQLGATWTQQLSKSAVHDPGEPHIGDYTGEGPNMATGQHLRSIQATDTVMSIGAIIAGWGSDSVQAARLEFGFYGMTDRAGRTFWTKPLPAFGPAGVRVEAALPDAIAGAIGAT